MFEMAAVERRVFGVLLEKALAASAYYPMTLQALVAACNQKSQRDPVMELDEDTVWRSMEVLRERGLVTRLLPSGSARTDRFKHEAHARFGWERPQQALMAELLLRGPQTAAELRSHCLRMYPFDTLDAVHGALARLQEAEPPWVCTLARGARESADRVAHRLYPPTEQPGAVRGSDEAPARVPGVPGAAAPVATSAAPAGHNIDTIVALRAALEALERRVAALEAERPA